MPPKYPTWSRKAVAERDKQITDLMLHGVRVGEIAKKVRLSHQRTSILREKIIKNASPELLEKLKGVKPLPSLNVHLEKRANLMNQIIDLLKGNSLTLHQLEEKTGKSHTTINAALNELRLFLPEIAAKVKSGRVYREMPVLSPEQEMLREKQILPLLKKYLFGKFKSIYSLKGDYLEDLWSTIQLESYFLASRFEPTGNQEVDMRKLRSFVYKSLNGYILGAFRKELKETLGFSSYEDAGNLITILSRYGKKNQRVEAVAAERGWDVGYARGLLNAYNKHKRQLPFNTVTGEVEYGNDEPTGRLPRKKYRG
ncbi:MAG: hypothetical protein V1494_06495 [Candidatus Diapherotrites archaeon]